MYEKLHVKIKVETRSTSRLNFISCLYFIYMILIYVR